MKPEENAAILLLSEALNKFENTPSGIGQFNHELLHLVSAIMRVRCLKHTEETEEAYAYYTGYLTEKILEKICR